MRIRWKAALVFLAVGVTGQARPGPADEPPAKPADRPPQQEQGAKSVEGAAAPAAALPKPAWRVGDSWTIETVTEDVQRRDRPGAKSPPIRWKFQVAGVDKMGGRDCYRIEIECLAKGLVRPRTTLWCDAETLMLRELRTQIAVDGAFRTLQESYEPGKSNAAPVLASALNALPIDLPAFLPAGAGNAKGGPLVFSYNSQPLPAGSKDPGITRFSHTVEQEVTAAGAKAMELLPRSFSKDLAAGPVVQVTLKGDRRQVRQLWQQGRPWPVYAENGRTTAQLVVAAAEKDGQEVPK